MQTLRPDKVHRDSGGQQRGEGVGGSPAAWRRARWQLHLKALAAALGRRQGALETGVDSDARIAGHHRLAAVPAHLLEMAGDQRAAITHYPMAADRTTSLPERNYLITQAARLSESPPGPDRTIPFADQEQTPKA